ncbi:MAG: biotin--[acetyl-CoA-carboxylase] ligase [Verrucomicrobia bacterium]|nr:biotin--[acetyl-CoA-carboxylase] ligase [Verrucomicrobiota bacterium]
MPRSHSVCSPEVTILRALLSHSDGFVSGAALAKTLAMSRVAVWQHMEKMREQGFAFEAVRAKGYRLTKQPTDLNATLIEAHLTPHKPVVGFQCFETIDSTNDEAARQLATGRQAPFVIASREQTRGRGRFGRTWHSESNGNLYLSFAFRPQLPPERMQTFTLWMGVNLCEFVASYTQVSPGLKWPNDILFNDRKAGGMLTEARIDADHIRDLVFGLGLNISSQTAAFPPEVARRAISLAEHATETLDLNKFAAAVIARVIDAYDRFVSGKYRDAFADLWHRFDYLKGKPVSLQHGSQHINGTAIGIDEEGSLIVRTDRGKTERFRAGEVTMSKKPV